MAPTTIYPDNYLLFNDSSTKNLMVVVQIEGVPDFIATGDIFTAVRYGDPGIKYGDPGLVYGGLRKRTDFKSLLNLDGSMTISQKIEPEQGRGAITLLTLSFTDKDGYFSRLITPGIVVDEPLGNKFVKIYLGYQNTSFPEDYFIVLRGYISSTTFMHSKVMIQISDPNIKRRSQVCRSETTKLTAPINSSVLSIPVVKTTGFYDHILGPDALFDTAVKTYIKIGDEYMEYGSGALGGTTITVTSRGARGTVAAAHSTNDDVENAIQLQDNIVTLALKLMLSGWNGNFLTGISCRSIVNTLDPVLGNINNAVLLPENIDAVLDLGLTVGTYMTISGSTAGNNKTTKINEITAAVGRQNRLLLCSDTFNLESPATGVSLAFRSKYDTLPILCGAKMKQLEVDIETQERLRNQFLSQNENRMRFLISEPITLKNFIEDELYLPLGAYSITRYGQVSMALTKPPIADQKLVVLDKTNVKDIATVSITRAVNNRRYFNEVDYFYDANDAGDFKNRLNFLDTQSLSQVTISSVLPIKSLGLKTDLSAAVLIPRRGTFLLRRYKQVAIEILLKVNWKIASQIEVGDVVLLRDDGNLKLLNFTDGTRNSQSQLYEVIERSMDIKSGDGTVRLLGSIGVNLTDRFGTISPSSQTDTGSTTTSIKIKDSWGALFPGNEKKKWNDAIGLPIFVHNVDYSLISNEVILTGFDPADKYKMLVSPALSFVPGANYTVEIAKYPDTTDPNQNALYKQVFCFIDPTVTVTSGVSSTNFFVSVADAAKLVIGNFILIHNTDYSILSPEVKVQSVDLGTGSVIVTSSLGFTPAAGQKVELIGFRDHVNDSTGGPYRHL